MTTQRNQFHATQFVLYMNPSKTYLKSKIGTELKTSQIRSKLKIKTPEQSH